MAKSYPNHVNGQSFGQEHKIIIRKILIERPKHTVDSTYDKRKDQSLAFRTTWYSSEHPTANPTTQQKNEGLILCKQPIPPPPSYACTLNFQWNANAPCFKFLEQFDFRLQPLAKDYQFVSRMAEFEKLWPIWWESYGSRWVISFTRYMYLVWVTTKNFSSHLRNTMFLLVAKLLLRIWTLLHIIES